MGKSSKSKRAPRPRSWLDPAWSTLGRRLAAAAGASAAMLALLADAPLHVASGRGFLAWLSILALFRIGARALGSRALGEPVDAPVASAPGGDPQVASRAADTPSRRAA